MQVPDQRSDGRAGNGSSLVSTPLPHLGHLENESNNSKRHFVSEPRGRRRGTKMGTDRLPNRIRNELTLLMRRVIENPFSPEVTIPYQVKGRRLGPL